MTENDVHDLEWVKREDNDFHFVLCETPFG